MLFSMTKVKVRKLRKLRKFKKLRSTAIEKMREGEDEEEVEEEIGAEVDEKTDNSISIVKIHFMILNNRKFF